MGYFPELEHILIKRGSGSNKIQVERDVEKHPGILVLEVIALRDPQRKAIWFSYRQLQVTMGKIKVPEPAIYQ